MKKSVILLVFVFFVCLNYVHAENLGLGDLDLNGLYIAFSEWSNQVNCGLSTSTPQYNPTNVLNTNYCGSNKKILNSAGSVAQTPSGVWHCITNNICNSKSNNAFNNLILVNTVNEASYTCPSGYSVLPNAAIYTGVVRASYMALCAKNEYFEYFKDEIRLTATSGGAWDPGDGTNCDTHIYDSDPSCHSGYKVISRNFVADKAGCKHGVVIRAALCVKTSNNGIINLDFDETKCKTIYGNSAWVQKNGVWGCCGDDTPIDAQCLMETKCNDNIDNDNDGLTDCNDIDCCSDSICKLHPFCTSNVKELCESTSNGWFIGFWWPSAISGTDQCCGNSPLINGDFEQ